MIRFVGKNDKAADHPSELIGRFVGKEGVMHSRGYTRPMKVVSSSGSRLHGLAGAPVRGGEGDYRLTPVDTWDEDCFLSIGTVAYVCDTIEECEAVLAASRRALKTWTEGLARLKSEIDVDFENVAAGFSHSTSPAP